MERTRGPDGSRSRPATTRTSRDSGSLSAERTGQETVATILKGGEAVAFGSNCPANDSGGSGVRVTGLVVTPPEETKSVTVDWPGADSLPVTEDGGSPVKVGPIGSAGRGGDQ